MNHHLNPPSHCDVCRAALSTEFFDARTKMGSWANLCKPCFTKYGIGLGTGFGQHYVLDAASGKFTKVTK